MSTSKPKTPSLVNPDFSGLWSVARLGHERKWYSRIVGAMILSIFLYSWIGGFVVPFFILFLFCMGYTTTASILTTIIVLPYFIKISPQRWVCRLYMKYGAHYFDGGCSQCLAKQPTDRALDQPILASVHPHGILCLGYFLCCGIRFRAIENVKDEKVKMEYSGPMGLWQNLQKRAPCKGMIVSYLCKAPLFNFTIAGLTGCCESASNARMKAVMKNKESFGLLPGGFNEATRFKKGENIIYIKKRKGFIKYCLQFGYELYPCYVFGECETYRNLFHTTYEKNSWTAKLKSWCNKNKIPTVFPIGPYWFSPFLPHYNTGLHSIFSGNTRCDQIEQPTQSEIDEYHKWYMDEINDIFEKHKWRFGYSDDVKLKIY